MSFPERDVFCSITTHPIKEERLKMNKPFMPFKMLPKEQENINRRKRFFKKANEINTCKAGQGKKKSVRNEK